MVMNLNETQKDLLRFLVQEVRNGKLDEDRIWFFTDMQGTTIQPKGKSLHGVRIPGIRTLETATLIALENCGCLICELDASRGFDKCALTSKAYEAVDSNFTPQGSEIFPSIAEIATEIQELLEQLSRTHSIETISNQKQLAMEAVNRVKNNSSLIQRLASACKAGSVSAFEQSLNHPAASFFIAAFKDWIKA